jgi:hypothetical protein
VTLYSTGPRRSLRPIARAIFQSWEGWPQFRDSWKGTNQQYQSVGIQHLLLPEPLRYLNDRFVSTNIGVPPTEAIVRISSEELLPALNNTFPLDVFQISLIPQAVRRYVPNYGLQYIQYPLITNPTLLFIQFPPSLLPCLRYNYCKLCCQSCTAKSTY